MLYLFIGIPYIINYYILFSVIVRPARFRKNDILISSPSVRIIDFGEAFLDNNTPSTIHTPLPVRAPEIIFGDVLDRRVDSRGAGCLVRLEIETLGPCLSLINMFSSLNS